MQEFKILNSEHNALQLQAQQLFQQGLTKEEVWVYFDPDVDGLISGFLVWEYLNRVHNIKAKYLINSNRAHGCFYSDQLRGSFVINVDSAISKDELQKFEDNNCILLSLDHHTIEPNILNTNHTLVFNSDYPFLKETYGFLSGAGVVDLFFSLYDSKFRTPLTVSYVGITLLSDSREIENSIAREILTETYSHSITEFPFIMTNLWSILNRQYDSGYSQLDRHFIDFKFSPFVNSALRFDDSTSIIEGFLGGELGYTVSTKDYRPHQKEVINTMLDSAQYLTFNYYLLVVLEKSRSSLVDVEESNFIGLIANRLLSKENKTVLILYKSNNKLQRGSVRGLYHTVNYLDIFNRSGFIGAGHLGAFGILGTRHRVNLKLLDRLIGQAESNHGDANPIRDVFNLRKEATELLQIAYENQFVRPLYKTYLRYRGVNVYEEVRKTNYVVYLVDGVVVKGFDDTLTIEDSNILPTYTNGLVEYVIERKNKGLIK